MKYNCSFRLHIKGNVYNIAKMAQMFSAARAYEKSSSEQKEEGYKLIEFLAPEAAQSWILDVALATSPRC